MLFKNSMLSLFQRDFLPKTLAFQAPCSFYNSRILVSKHHALFMIQEFWFPSTMLFLWFKNSGFQAPCSFYNSRILVSNHHALFIILEFWFPSTMLFLWFKNSGFQSPCSFYNFRILVSKQYVLLFQMLLAKQHTIFTIKLPIKLQNI